MGKIRQSRKSLSLKDKTKVIGLLKDKKSEREIATLFGVSKSQIHRLSVNKENIQKCYDDNLFVESKKRLANESRHPELDNSVLQWFKEMRNPTSKCKPLSLSRTHIQARAVHEAKLRGILNFKASDGWFRNWRKRCLIGPSLRLFGEADDVNITEMEPLIQVLNI